MEKIVGKNLTLNDFEPAQRRLIKFKDEDEYTCWITNVGLLSLVRVSPSDIQYALAVLIVSAKDKECSMRDLETVVDMKAPEAGDSSKVISNVEAGQLHNEGEGRLFSTEQHDVKSDSEWSEDFRSSLEEMSALEELLGRRKTLVREITDMSEELTRKKAEFFGIKKRMDEVIRKMAKDQECGR